MSKKKQAAAHCFQGERERDNDKKKKKFRYF